MMRAPPSRILPGPEDVHYHLERVFMRLAARYQADIPPDSDDDDGFGDDLPSVDGTDTSSRAPSTSSTYSSAFGCPQWSRSPSQTNGADNNQIAENPKGKSRAQEQDVSGPGSQAGSRSSSTGSCVVHRDRESTPRAVNQREANPDRYAWKHLSLPPIPRANPRVLLAIPEGRALDPSFSHAPSALGFPSLQQHSQVSSLRSLFESLSLKSLPDHTARHQNQDDSENRRPFHQSQNSKSCLRAEVDIHLSPWNTSPSDIRDSMAGPIKNNADASQNDVPMQDVLPSQKPVAGPDDTESEGLIRETPVSQSKRSRMPKYAIQKVNPIRKPRNDHESTGDGTVAANKEDSPTTKPAGAGQEMGNTASNVGLRQDGNGQSQPSASSAATSTPTNAQANNKVQRQTPVTAQGQPTPAATSQQQQSVTSQTTQSSARPVNTQTSAATSSSDSNNNSVASQTRTPAPATSSSQAAMAMSPDAAAAPLGPEEWEHMMEVSHAFHNHVQQMFAELDQEHDIVDDFGLGDLRRQPFGAWHDH